MNRRDRLANLLVFALATAAWVAVGYVFINFNPQDNSGYLLAGALLLGAATGFTLMPVFWLASFVRTRGIAYRGDWWRAARRGLLLGLVVTIFVVLRSQDLFSLPLALFVVVMALLVELTLSLRR